MKHLFYSIALAVLLASCSDNKYQKLMTDHFEISDGTRHNLNVKYSKFDLSDFTVQDSIDILNKIHETKNAKGIKNLESLIEIEEDLIRISRSRTEDRLNTIKTNLENLKNSKADLSQYEERNPQDVLATKVDVIFSYDHPLLKTRAEESGTAIINLEATKVIKYTQKK